MLKGHIRKGKEILRERVQWKRVVGKRGTGAETAPRISDAAPQSCFIFIRLLYSCLILRNKGGVPDLYFIFYKSISCNNSAKTWDRSLEFGMWYLYYM